MKLLTNSVYAIVFISAIGVGARSSAASVPLAASAEKIRSGLAMPLVGSFSFDFYDTYALYDLAIKAPVLSDTVEAHCGQGDPYPCGTTSFNYKELLSNPGPGENSFTCGERAGICSVVLSSLKVGAACNGQRATYSSTFSDPSGVLTDVTSHLPQNILRSSKLIKSRLSDVTGISQNFSCDAAKKQCTYFETCETLATPKCLSFAKSYAATHGGSPSAVKLLTFGHYSDDSDPNQFQQEKYSGLSDGIMVVDYANFPGHEDIDGKMVPANTCYVFEVEK